jgi:hypothetical protein
VRAAIPLFCPFKALTGIPCPGCGMTRALLSLAKGDFQGAFHFNPFSFFLVFMVLISMAPGGQLKRLPPGAPVVMNCLYVGLLFMVLAYWFFERLLPAVS